MKCSPDFVRFYNETFRFIGESFGHENLCEYWLLISPVVLYDLKEKLKYKGLFGAYEYWLDVLDSEKAEYEMKLNDEGLKLLITDCPSIRALKEPYKDYCEHCQVMYKPIFNSCGYDYKLERLDSGKCRITINVTESENVNFHRRN